MKFRCTCKATFTQCNGLQDLPSYMTLGQEGALLANDQPLSMQATLDLGKKSASSQLLSVHHFSSDQTCLHTHTHTLTHMHMSVQCLVLQVTSKQRLAHATAKAGNCLFARRAKCSSAAESKSPRPASRTILTRFCF